ncbi:polysaccharide pyruvyl transferase family protein [Cellulophaga sp. E6(2014)]|uniref:polysaccharide pyruvyl transferase family protein n=1 Tax=Cellulophaga sp. E6(2014) TaxID=1495334 RepID=UPI00051DC9DF|nr:polysaccharide pyruvyl transferase family protein [Cellulophaga sp. E6(2014)]KGK29314.1 hypothetical protein EL45_16600 [Cellulophaga sp. E6(2014)]
MKIIVENSTWNNLGDGFYQFTLFELLKKIYPDENIVLGEGPVERAFRPKEKQLQNAFKAMDYEKADFHVFSGPMLPRLTTDYAKLIENIEKSGDNYALISCSIAGLAGEKLNRLREFLKKHPPICFSTRDPYTYEMLKDVVPNGYNGICTAFLVNKLLTIDTCNIDKKYFVSSFYRAPEPSFSTESKNPKIEDIKLVNRKPYLPFVSWKYNRHLEIYKKYQSSIEDLEIVRTVQQVSTKSNNFNFKYPNSFITWNPLNQLSILKGAEFTISERVHACATTLAFGKPARITYDNARSGIFDRFGLDYKTNNGIMYPDGLNDKIDLEMDLLIEYIKRSFQI